LLAGLKVKVKGLCADAGFVVLVRPKLVEVLHYFAAIDIPIEPKAAAVKDSTDSSSYKFYVANGISFGFQCFRKVVQVFRKEFCRSNPIRR
jgi:hypothetical protein